MTTFGGTGDLDLYLRRGLPATCQGSSVVVEPCPRDVLFSENDGNAESIQVSNPAAGDWYIALTAYDGYKGVTLLVSVATPGAISAAPTAMSFRQAPGGSPPAGAIDRTQNDRQHGRGARPRSLLPAGIG